MEYLRSALLPRRLTEMYADTKRTYEQIVQTDITNPQLSSLHLKLKVQKDRLVAWGLEWADSKNDRADDIDGSLDRAGISDLVASIMSSIRELLEEAERIHPQPRPQLPGAFPLDKSGLMATTSTPWTPAKLARLEDIVKDISTSIDTLCDLSRSQQMLKRQHGGQDDKKSPSLLPSWMSEKAPPTRSTSEPILTTHAHAASPTGQDQSSLISSSRIDPNDLVYPTRPQSAGSSPPSYDTSATDPGNRSFAFLKRSALALMNTAQPRPNQDVGVLVDYYSEDGATPKIGPLPSLRRYEDLVLALQGFPQRLEHAYTGSFRLLGWFYERQNSRYAFVYEIPRPPQVDMPQSTRSVHPPQSLLSYLQHSGDTDTNNTPSLEDRFRLALNLATNILHVHAKGLTHRNINSNNVVFVNGSEPRGIECKPWKEGTIRKPYLVSWDQCAEDTSTHQPETLISSIYRHPEISRGQRSAYRAVHDIYSLGLVLLEVGLWMPLNKLWKTKYRRSDFKSRLQEIYAKKLAGKCGNGYMSAVEHCLKAVEVDRLAHATPQQSSREQQRNRHTDFYWNVLKPLERCCMLDVSDEPRISPTASTPSTRPQALETVSDAEPSTVPQEQPSEESRDAIANASLWDALKTDSPTEPGVKADVCIWSHSVPTATRTYFDTVMMPKLSRMFAKAINRWESYEIHVCMAGETPETAKPTILMVCRSILRAWKILRHVNEDKGLFDIHVASGQVTRSKRGKNRRPKKSQPAQKQGKLPSRYQQKPTCGASIGCFVDEQHSEAVTFGGVVLVNGEAHGMSVHHMLEDPDAGPGQDDSTKSSWPPNIANLPGLEDDLPGSFDLLDISDDEFDGLQSSTQGDFNFDVEEELNAGDVPGTMPGQGSHIIVTQPALDDVEPEFFPDEDEISDDHLVIHGFGSIHASSGLRRFTYGEVAHEVDWALFKLHDDRKPAINKVDGGSKHCKKAARTSASYPCQVIKADALGDLQVHAFGSTSGLASGKILPSMQMTKMPGRLYPSPVWRVKGNFGVGGDSGAWVIDNATGGVCGHVTAYSESWEYATIAPMEVLLRDMEDTLGASVSLPDSDDAAILSFQQQIVDIDRASSKTVEASQKAKEKVREDPPCVQDEEGDDRGDEEDVMSCMDRKMSHDTDYTVDTKTEDRESLHGISPATSPALPTSPVPSQTMSVLNLNSVAAKWNKVQDNKGESLQQDDKGAETTIHDQEGSKGKCWAQEKKRDSYQKDDRGAETTIHVQEGSKGKCWAQENKRDLHQQDDRGVGTAVCVQEGLKAKC